MYADRDAPVAAEPPPTGRSDAEALQHATSSAPMDFTWERVAGVRLGRRSVSPQRRPATDLMVCEPVSWQDAADSRPSGWAHNATLVDPCYHHPRSSFSRSINTSIAEDDVQLQCHHVEIVTDNRSRPHREAARDLPLQLGGPESHDEMFRMDDEELQLPPKTCRPSALLRSFDSTSDQGDCEEEASEETERCSSSVPIPLGPPCRAKQDAAGSPSPVFTVLQPDR